MSPKTPFIPGKNSPPRDLATPIGGSLDRAAPETILNWGPGTRIQNENARRNLPDGRFKNEIQIFAANVCVFSDSRLPIRQGHSPGVAESPAQGLGLGYHRWRTRWNLCC